MQSIRHDELTLEMDELRRQAEKAKQKPAMSAIEIQTEYAADANVLMTSTASTSSSTLYSSVPATLQNNPSLWPMPVAEPKLVASSAVDSRVTPVATRHSSMDARAIFLKQGK